MHTIRASGRDYKSSGIQTVIIPGLLLEECAWMEMLFGALCWVDAMRVVDRWKVHMVVKSMSIRGK
jgi:hypothetical protein